MTDLPVAYRTGGLYETALGGTQLFLAVELVLGRHSRTHQSGPVTWPQPTPKRHGTAPDWRGNVLTASARHAAPLNAFEVACGVSATCHYRPQRNRTGARARIRSRRVGGLGSHDYNQMAFICEEAK